MRLIVTWYISSRWNWSFVMSVTPKPGLDVAGVAAVLPIAIAIGHKGLPALRAGVFIEGFSVNLILVRVPPLHAAGIGAELLFLPMRCLFNRLTAAGAEMNFGRGYGSSMPPEI
jgi:hypothetical protein